MSRETGPALVGVVNGYSENNIMLKYYGKGNGDCIAIYPLPKNRTFIRGSILEFKIVSSDKIVVVHLGRPRALPTIENWDFLPHFSVGGLIKPPSGERFTTTLVFKMDLKSSSSLLGRSGTLKLLSIWQGKYVLWRTLELQVGVLL